MNAAETYLRRAVELAERGVGFTAPNPLVGCVIVRDGEVIGEGWHQRYGEAHAEVNAVLDAEARGHTVAGAEVFVTLEPCAHRGKTPPCVDQLIAKKVRSVTILFSDPNPLTAGKSIEKLRVAGITVHTDFPELRLEHTDLYADFTHFIATKTPFVALKMAMDRNGFIAGTNGTCLKIGGPEEQAHTHSLRQHFASILVGVNTVLNDNPHLGVRLGNFYQGRRDPLRIILDPHLRAPEAARILRDENFLLITTVENVVSAQQKFGERVLALPLLSNGRFDLHQLLKTLGARNISNVLVEGGAKTAQSFILQRCAHKGCFFVSEKAFTTEGIKGIDFQNLPEFSVEKKERFGSDTLFEGKFFFISKDLSPR